MSQLPFDQSDYIKSNFLIGAKYKSTLLENKILAYSLSIISTAKEDKDGCIVSEIQAAELKKILGVNTHAFYDRLDPVANSLTGKSIGMTNPELKIFDYLAVVIRSTYENGVLTIKYNPDIKPYINNITQNFTRLKLETMLQFRSVFSFRLYEILKSKAYTPKHSATKENTFTIRFSLSELKLSLGIVNAELSSVKRILSNTEKPDYDKAVEMSPEKSFEAWTDLKKKVLEVAKKEINETTDIFVTYTPLKGGRGGKVYAIDFTVTFKQSVEEAPKEELSEDAKMALIFQMSDYIEEKLMMKDIKAIAEAAEYDFERVKKAYKIAKDSTKGIDNLVGFMIKAIREGYEEPVKTARKDKNNFNNFENQNEYDFEQLEAELLSYDKKNKKQDKKKDKKQEDKEKK